MIKLLWSCHHDQLCSSLSSWSSCCEAVIIINFATAWWQLCNRMMTAWRTGKKLVENVTPSWLFNLNVVWVSFSTFVISWLLCTMIILIIVFSSSFYNYFISSNCHFGAMTRCVTTFQNNYTVSNQHIVKTSFTNHEILTVSSFFSTIAFYT